MSAFSPAIVDLIPIDDLDRQIVSLSSRIYARTYELLVLIRRFDERAGWLRWGFDNCADWLHWRCDLSMNASREKVRVAHALKTLPRIAAAFSKGQLSYSKVRALTRVADKSREDDLLAFAYRATAGQVEERCREIRFATKASVIDANRAHANRSLTVRRDDLRGTMVFTLEVTVEDGQLIDKALDRARDDEAIRPELANESWSARQADAIVDVAKSYLSGNKATSSAPSENYQVVIHVDRAALVDGEGRSGLPVESVRRLCCDADTVTIVEDENGEPLNIGRKSRTIPTAIKRALWARDKGCRFPGCHRKRFVDGHHIEHWTNGGETSLGNLILLCSMHHRHVHEGGFRIEKDYQDRWCFVRPDGIAVPHCGYHTEDTTDDDVDEVSTPVNNPPAGGLAAGVT